MTEQERNELLREKVRERLSRTLMRLPDKVDLLHLGQLLHDTWEDGYHTGVRDYQDTGPDDDVNETDNPYLW